MTLERSNTNDREALRKWRWAYWCFAAVLLTGFAYAIHHVKVWRAEHDPRVEGTILEVWRTERTRSIFNRSSTPPHLMGRIAFTRMYKGQSFDCEVIAVIGEPDETLKVGDKIDVTPRVGSCYDPLIPRMVEK